MNKLYMGTLDLDEESMEIVVSDLQVISKVPESVKNVISTYCRGKKKAACGLPLVKFLGSDGVQVSASFSYGEISFMEIEGEEEDVLKQESFLCIEPYVEAEKPKEIVKEEKSVESEESEASI